MMNRWTRLLLSLTLSAAWILGQEKAAPATANPMQAEIISVKTLSGDAFNRLAKMLEVFGVRYVADERLRTILVYAPKDIVAQMRSVVERLDRPGSEAAIGRNIDMTLSFLLCSAKEPATVRSLPADLEPVVRQLRAASLCKEATLLDTVPLRVQEGKQSQHTASMPGFPTNVPGQSVRSQLDIRPEAIVRKEADRYVRFAKVSVLFRVPYTTGGTNNTQFQYSDLGIDTAGDFKEGQKTVLGKISGVDSDSSLFVVIALKILD